MALIFTDSWDHYTSITNKWTSNSFFNFASQSITSAAGRHSSNGFRCSTSGATSGSNATKVMTDVVPSGDTCIVGFSLHNPTTTGQTWFYRLQNPSGDQFLLYLNSSGTITAVGQSTLATSTYFLLSNQVYYIECKVQIGNSGNYEVRVNGVNILSGTSVDTQAQAAATWDRIVLGTQNTNINATFDYDDLYVLDGTGIAPWNTFLGDVRVDARFPTAEGNYSDWTPSTGTDNSALVDETAPNSDTDYNSTTTTNAKDTFVIQDAPSVGAPILGVQFQVWAEKADAGAASIGTLLRHAGVDYDGTSTPLNTSYTYFTTINQTNPGTGLQWVEADFNAVELGYKKTL